MQLVLGIDLVQGEVGGLPEEGGSDLGTGGQPKVGSADPVVLTSTC